MKRTLTLLSLTTALAVTMVACNQQSPKKQLEASAPTQNIGELDSADMVQDTIKKSIPSESIGRIGDATIKIEYHSPGVKGRVVWGGLVPYDQVWVTGAHKATTVEFDKDLLIAGKSVAPGKYALFTIPGREEWTIILNKNWDQHLADEYDQNEDILRTKVKPYSLKHPQERLKYRVEDSGEAEAGIRISWEKIGIRLPVAGE
ncbi:DUF2911 domain-containing protein [Rufibacter sp. LB8]|uniref:DUF2911 domain-containing protein n=1 Tax=Rufibacter sp. LB8 TaxID=2777781 RepID=UPI00178C7652|nr:DUF2911 domain-containing protein [Rufibacter sp. LB8]